MIWFPFTYILDNLITNSIYAWLTKDYRSSGMSLVCRKLSYKENDKNVLQLYHDYVMAQQLYFTLHTYFMSYIEVNIIILYFTIEFKL